MKTNDPKATVLAYHEAFYSNNRPAVRALLGDEGNFVGPLNSFTNPDTFLDSASIFMRLSTKAEIKKVLVEDNDVCVIYEGTYDVPSIPTLPMAAWFKVDGGKINFFQVHFDPTPFVKAKESGDLGKALQGRK